MRAGRVCARRLSGSGAVGDQIGRRNYLASFVRRPPVDVNRCIATDVALPNFDTMETRSKLACAICVGPIYRTRIVDDRLSIDREPSGIVCIDAESINAGAWNKQTSAPDD